MKNIEEYNNYDSRPDVAGSEATGSVDEMDNNIDEELDREWINMDMLQYEKNYKNNKQFITIPDADVDDTDGCEAIGSMKNKDEKFILTDIDDEDTSKNTGYIIEHHGYKITVTNWIFEGDNEKYDERVMYDSMESFYDDSKRFVKSDLVNYSLLHKSRYKMMCDFIKYYDECKTRYTENQRLKYPNM